MAIQSVAHLNSNEIVSAIGASGIGEVFRAGTPKLLFQVPAQPSTGSGDGSIDSKRFFFLAPVQQADRPHLTVVLNWASPVKK